MPNKIKILFFGDVVGKTGIKGLSLFLNKYNKKNKADFIFINGENISGGKGLNKKNYHEIKKMNIDGITLGNHTFCNRDIIDLIKEKNDIIRPLNYPIGLIGNGYSVFSKENFKVAVISLCGRIYMNSMILDCPFRKIESLLKKIKIETNIIIVDIHAESTAEKKALGFFLNKKVNCIFGTHTHIQTNDLQFLSEQTLYLTDIGMVGAKESILGCKKNNIINHFISGMPFKLEVESEGEIQVNGVEVVLNKNGYIEKSNLINVII